MSLPSTVRVVAAAALVAVAFAAHRVPRVGCDGRRELLQPDYPAPPEFAPLPMGRDFTVSGAVSGGDGGPWQVSLENGSARATTMTGSDGSFSFAGVENDLYRS